MPQVVDEDGDIFEVNADGSYTHIGNTRAAPQQGPAPVTLGRPRPQEAPSGYRWSDSGLQAIPGGPADKPREDPNAAKLPTGYRWKADGSGAELIPGVAAPGDNAKGDPGKAGAYKSVIQQVDRLYQLYNQGIGSTSGLSSVFDYLPTDANAAFDTAGAALGDQGNAAFKVPGMGAQSDADAARFVAANQPQSTDRDVAALEKLRAIRQRLENNMAAIGLPAPQWQYDLQGKPITPQDDQQPVAGAFGAQNPPTGGNPPMGGGGPQTSPVTAINGVGAGQQVATGAMKTIDNPAFKGVNARVNGMLQQGASTQQIVSYLRSAGVNVDDPKIQESLAGAVGWRNRNPNFKGNYSVNVDDMAVPTTALERFGATPVGSAAAGYLNAGGMGVPEMLAPETFAGMRSQNPLSSLAGEVGGAITGTSLIGRAGAAGAAKVAPRLLGGGKGAQFARNLGTDAAYGAAYGGTTQGDPLSGALYGSLGSAAGQGVASAVGRAASGAAMSRPAQSLRNMGVNNLTIGQMLGGKAKGLEDAMTSAPILGDIVNARRLEGLQDFNLAALNQAGQPIGATVAETGENGLNALMGDVGNAYDNATRGVRVPLDPQFSTDMGGVAAYSQKLPPDYALKFDKIGENRVGPAISAGELTGDTYQQAMRGLKGARSTAGQAAPGFEQDYRDGLTAAMGALRGQMQRGGGQSVVDGLGKADESYRLAKTIGAAQSAAKNGSGSGEVQIFTPAQLNTAGYAAQKKFPGARPFASLADAGQEVLPSKIPDSGTARRMATLALPSILGGAGAGAGSGYLLGDTQQGALSGAALTALLVAGGTKGGQKMIEKALFNRPASVGRVGRAIRKKKGLFGHAAAPLAIENSGQ